MARQEPQQEQVAALEESTARTVSAPRAHRRRGEGMRPRTDQPDEGGGYGEKHTEVRGTQGVKVAGAATAAETNDGEAGERAGAAGAAGSEAAVAVAEPGAAAGGGAPEVATAVEMTVGRVADPGRAGGTAAAAHVGSSSPSATRTASRLAEGRGPVAEQGQSGEVGLAESPASVAAAEIAAVVTAAAGGRDREAGGVELTAAAASDGTSAADEGAGTQGHGQAGDGRQDRGKSVAAPVARGKKGKKPRAQPAARRPGAGLGPAATVVAAAAEEIAPPQTGTRRSTRLGPITWGPPRGGRTPWMPAGRGAGNVAAGITGGTGRGARGGLRGGLWGGRGGRNPVVRSDVPVRTGPWRERHDRPEILEAGANEERDAFDNCRDDPEFMGGEEEESEEISLDEEHEPGRRATQSRGGAAAGGNIQDNPGGGEQPATEDTDVPSPADLAGDDAIWLAAGAWNVHILQKGEQPFLVRRLPPQILDRYTLCMLAALHRLDKNPSCLGGWLVLQFLPRLTLRPAPEPVTGSRWTHIEARLHKFQKGEWVDLYEEAGVIPDIGGAAGSRAGAAGSAPGGATIRAGSTVVADAAFGEEADAGAGTSGTEAAGATSAPRAGTERAAASPAGADATGATTGARGTGAAGGAGGASTGADGPASTTPRGAAGAGGRVFSASAVAASGVGGGPENGYQAAARAALTNLDTANEDDERQDPSYREEATPDSEGEETEEEEGGARENPGRMEAVEEQARVDTPQETRTPPDADDGGASNLRLPGASWSY
ncbi:unnamed protein product [Closterium sp. Naga37s-1]|nr:unnamed protein product [Closterium sp. Naga37s-1]